MTKEEQRVAIAEACGYTSIELLFGWIPPDSIGDLPQMVKLPDYLNDLNAMHEAEKVLVLDKGQYRDYLYNLSVVCKISGWKASDIRETFLYIHATATQRAEAFLRTIGKWKDS